MGCRCIQLHRHHSSEVWDVSLGIFHGRRGADVAVNRDWNSSTECVSDDALNIVPITEHINPGLCSDLASELHGCKLRRGARGASPCMGQGPRSMPCSGSTAATGHFEGAHGAWPWVSLHSAHAYHLEYLSLAMVFQARRVEQSIEAPGSGQVCAT